MKRLPLYLTILALACLGSCVYPYDSLPESRKERTLVVDGRILIGGISSIQLNYVTPLNATGGSYPSGDAWIEDDLGNIFRDASHELSRSFSIHTESPAAGASSYRAVVEVDGERYASDWIVPDNPPVIDDITFEADDDNVSVMVDLGTGDSKTGYAGFLLEENWEFHADEYPRSFINTATWEYYTDREISNMDSLIVNYWCFRSDSTKSVIMLDYSNLEGDAVKSFPVKTFPRTDSRNHKRYSVNVKAFSLSKDAYDYGRRLREMSNVGSDLFTPDPGTLNGNIHCETDPLREVMGIVLAGKMTSRRAFMRGQYAKQAQSYVPFVFVEKEDMPLMYYDRLYRPVRLLSHEDTMSVGWAPIRCIDCIEDGGTQTPPDFWNEEEN